MNNKFPPTVDNIPGLVEFLTFKCLTMKEELINNVLQHGYRVVIGEFNIMVQYFIFRIFEGPNFNLVFEHDLRHTSPYWLAQFHSAIAEEMMDI